MTPEVSDYLDQRLQAISKLIYEDEELARCEVEVGRAAGHPERGNIWRAELNLAYKGYHLRAEATAETVNAAIDEVKDDITSQLRRGKRLHIRLARRGGALLKRLIRRE